MKKHYQAPEILFEDFTLSTSVAAKCDIVINNQSDNGCPYIMSMGMEDVFVFLDDINNCTYKQADGVYNNICYHVPHDKNDLFNS